MPLDIRRFGVGHRRPEGPPGTVGVTGQVVHSDERGVIAELAFARGARMEAHSNPNLTWLLVIEGGGWVEVGGERARVAAGEAVRFPPSVVRAVWTDHSPMRAIAVELGAVGSEPLLLLEGLAVPLPPAEEDGVAKADGSLRDDPGRAVPYDPGEGEPV